MDAQMGERASVVEGTEQLRNEELGIVIDDVWQSFLRIWSASR